MILRAKASPRSRQSQSEKKVVSSKSRLTNFGPNSPRMMFKTSKRASRSGHFIVRYHSIARRDSNRDLARFRKNKFENRKCPAGATIRAFTVRLGNTIRCQGRPCESRHGNNFARDDFDVDSGPVQQQKVPRSTECHKTSLKMCPTNGPRAQ